jgi:pimeloyl-ACP methyl ester carboxylesterase
MGLGSLPTLRSNMSELAGTTVNYVEGGVGSPVVLVHGWGAEIASFGPVPSLLAERFRVHALDLPGFGRSPVPDRPWGTADYATCVGSLIEQNGLAPCTLVGHSFGGQISIYLAATRPELVRKLVLVNCAGIRARHSVSYHVRVGTYKVARKVLARPLPEHLRDPFLGWVRARLGSSDYQAAVDPILRNTLVTIVNEDQQAMLPRIKAPTLLIWGDLDRDTPLADARLMEKLIPDAGLVIFPGAGHFSYLDRLDQFCRVVTHFVEH